MCCCCLWAADSWLLVVGGVCVVDAMCVVVGFLFVKMLFFFFEQPFGGPFALLGCCAADGRHMASQSATGSQWVARGALHDEDTVAPQERQRTKQGATERDKVTYKKSTRYFAKKYFAQTSGVLGVENQ